MVLSIMICSASDKHSPINQCPNPDGRDNGTPIMFIAKTGSSKYPTRRAVPKKILCEIWERCGVTLAYPHQ